MRRRDALRTVAAAVGLPLASTGATRAPSRVARKGKLAPPTGSFVEVRDGTKLFYRDYGSGRPLVFAAPWGLNSDWWEYQTTALADRGLRCVSYDRRGHGRSSEPVRGYDFDTLADDLASLIDQLQLRDVTLVGHSMGCGEVVRYLSRHASPRIRRVVLVGTITPFIMKTDDNPEGVARAELEKARVAFAMDRAERIATAAPAFFGAPKNPVSSAMMEWWTRMMLDRTSLRTLLTLHREFTETDFRSDLRSVRVPTLLIHGDSDTSARLDRTARPSAEMIHGCELKIYEGAAHGLPVTHMARLNADLLAFATSS
jgi:non-heme chloroperoxidase